MCASHVYRRRRLQNSVTLLSSPKGAKVSYDIDYCNSSIASTSLPITLEEKIKRNKESMGTSLNGGTHDNYYSVAGLNANVDGSSNPNHTSNLQVMDNSLKQRVDLPLEPSLDNNCNTMSDHNCSINDSCSSSKSSLEQYSLSEEVECDEMEVESAKTEVESDEVESEAESDEVESDEMESNEMESNEMESNEMEECSSSEVIVSNVPSNFSSSKDFCVHVLRANESNDHPIKTISGALVCDILGGDDASFCFPCKICESMENPKKMLICDLCEGAFHLHCCHQRGPIRDEWYCKSCSRKNPKPLLDVAMGKTFGPISEEYKRRILEKELGPLQFMLKDTKPYISKVRIGSAFQAEVPEWSTLIKDDDESFGDPSLCKPVECAHLSVLNLSKSARLSSIGNWVQCREVIYNRKDKHGGGNICGKWRRAPLFVTQTDEWDCSCAVVWDPIHADCAVPQELDTEEVLKQLKFVEMIRSRLDKKQTCDQGNSRGRPWAGNNTK